MWLEAVLCRGPSDSRLQRPSPSRPARLAPRIEFPRLPAWSVALSRAHNRQARPRRHAWSDSRGSMAVEFAIVGPLLVLLLLGIMAYGGYFMLSHSVQQIADDSARAAVAGLTDTERQQLATTTMANDAKAYDYLQSTGLALTYANQNQTVTVQVAYDASKSPFWALSGMLPMPPSTIVRTASVQLGGF